ncbi:hypothetical protein B296_00050035 [Ensete ventricosum]|uniref:Uncharacterized protein n=1 Tax=Ensete ventricosum TaxID=4639 RepID=A0A426X0R3_ENSVE|nr:hypothetical protein B296_00050035 [Ensete ventricosum]
MTSRRNVRFERTTPIWKWQEKMHLVQKDDPATPVVVVVTSSNDLGPAIRPRRAKITVDFSSAISIAIATPIQKALFGPHAFDLVALKSPWLSQARSESLLRPQSEKLSLGPTRRSLRNNRGKISGPKTIPLNAYDISFRRSGTKRGATAWSSLGGHLSGKLSSSPMRG